ncbi:MAG: enoyl-CoA hydratase/isomerase family protein [Planctomycetes bacterium]|nr:enoyl-CoA hydratase/isomerase family protein [Planctomycetota bacterium]
MAFLQADNLWVNQLADGVADLVLDVLGSDLNLLKPAVLDELERALDAVARSSQFRLLMLRSSKPASFCHGIDFNHWAELARSDDFVALSQRGQRLCDRLVNLPIPSVALISGACLGAGLDLALACDYRVALTNGSTQIGSTEVDIGLLPAWGGTQRLPRCVGLERGLMMLLGSRQLSATEAKAWGLVDELATSGDEPPRTFVSSASKRSLGKLPRRTTRQRLIESNPFGRWLIYRGTDRLLRRRLPEDLPAPWACLETVRFGLKRGLEAGLNRETEALGELSQTEAFRNLLRLQLGRAALRLAHTDVDSKRTIRKIGVLGAGDLGAAWTHLAVTHGCQVIIRESNELALGLASFGMMALFQQEVAKGLMSREEMMTHLSKIHGTSAWREFDEVDLVLDASECVRDARQTLYREMEKQISPDAIVAFTRGTSSIAELQECMKRPERAAGLRLMDASGRRPLVEIVATTQTNERARRRLSDFVISLGRVPQLVPDLPGNLVHRLLFPYWNEAVLLIREGFQPQRIDETMVFFGMARGPLEQLDELGLDVAAQLAQSLEATLASRLAVDPLFAWMVENRWLGQKSRIGFYQYKGRKRKPHAALVAQLRAESHVAAPHQIDATPVAEQRSQIKRRLVWMMVNEAAHCIREGRSPGPDELDRALVHAGWAPHRGGPFRFARHTGVEETMTALDELADALGPRYAPCDGLQKMIS